MLKNQLLAVYPLALLVGLGFSQAIKANSDVGSNSFSSQTQFQTNPQTDCRHGCFNAEKVIVSPAPSPLSPPPPVNDENNDNFDNEQDFYQDQNPDLNDNGDYYNSDQPDYPDNNDHDNDNGYNGGDENPNPG